MTDQPFDVFALPVHPAAEEFPMLPEAELKALAADIKANGLKHPVLVGRVQRCRRGSGWNSRVA